MEHIGYVGVPSFPAQFSSSVVKGRARFVPAEGDAQGCVGRSFDVEINQERVTDLRRVNREADADAVVALPEFGAFRVCGTVASVVPLGEPEGSDFVTIAAGEAAFILCEPDLCGVKLTQGETVAFVAHDVSLWDEAI